VVVDLTNKWQPHIELLHRPRQEREGDAIVTSQVGLAFTVPTYGGRRAWFVCPRTGGRATKLFLPNGGREFLSRQAYGLAYVSEREDRLRRLQRKAASLNERLGGEGQSTWDVPPAKPTRMHWKTYTRLLAEWQRTVDQARSYWTSRTTALLERRGIRF
jgi:hypothetical protein